MARKLVILACLLAVSQMGCLAQPASSTDPFQDTGVTTTTGSPTTFSPATSQTAPAPSPTAALELASQYASSPGHQATSSRLNYTGVATTAYTSTPLTVYGASNLGCGLGYISSNFTSYYVGLGASFFNQGYSCGRCVKLQCDDATCAEPGRTLNAMVVDYCGNCYDADMAIANPLFLALTGRSSSPNPSALFSWEFIDCEPYVNGTIKMLVKQGGNAYYQAVSFANSIVTITAAQMNGDLLTHGADNFWSWNPASAIDANGPFYLDILGSNGQILQFTLPSLQSTDLGAQFTVASTAAPSPAPEIAAQTVG